MINDREILALARRSIEIESQTLIAVRDALNDTFINAVNHIHENNGRVVVTGIGKSAIIAQKIVATLNSTGTPALFMHAADAIHGDLGMISREDIVLCLSKSGETPEIRVLVPLVRQFGNTLIAMVSNTDSYLAKSSDFILHTPVSMEADPNNLAPTASTTAQIALGDALAISLLALKNFGISDFAQFHPGGSLGKQLYLRVSDLVDENNKPAIEPSDNIRKVILEITSHRLGATAVVKSGKLVGIITDGDLRRMLERQGDVSAYTAADIMTKTPRTIDIDTMAIHAFNNMRENSITQLIVTGPNGTYEGMIHLHDLIREGFV